MFVEELALALLIFHFQNQYNVIKPKLKISTPETAAKKHDLSGAEIHTPRVAFSGRRLTGADRFTLST